MCSVDVFWRLVYDYVVFFDFSCLRVVFILFYYVCLMFLFFILLHFVLFFFFFQAEDGIRDHCVTGVQTCALPISAAPAGTRTRLRSTCSLLLKSASAARLSRPSRVRSWVVKTMCAASSFSRSRLSPTCQAMPMLRSRSEERRVGKECRSRGRPEA